MDTIKIPCNITIDTALAQGSVEAGAFHHRLTTVELAELGPKEIGYVALLAEGKVVALKVDGQTWPAILRAIRDGAAALEEAAAREIDAKAERYREEQTKLEQLDEIVRSATLDEIIARNGYGQHVAEWPSEAFAIGAHSRGYSEPQVETALRRVGRYDEVMAEVKRRQDIDREEEAAAKARRAAEEKAKEEAAKTLSLQRREWVRAHAEDLPPNLVRAAHEERKIDKGLADWLAERIRATSQTLADRCGGYLVEHTYGEEPRDGVPNKRSYDALDCVTEHLSTYTDATLGESVPSGAPSLVRVDIEPRGSAVWRTALKVTLSSTLGWGDDVEYILTEPLNLDPDDDDE